MKKFYEAPVVELTGFTAEDVITTSVINTAVDSFETSDFDAALAAKYNVSTSNVHSMQYNNYTW